MEFLVLGPLEVLDDDRAVVSVGGRMQRALLALMLIHVNEALSVYRIIEGLWPEERPDDPESTVTTYISRLRSSIGKSLVESMPHGYRIRLTADELDAIRFEDSVLAGREAATRRQPGPATELFDEALSLWRGRPYDDVGYEHFVQIEVQRLEELRLSALEDRMDAALNLGKDSVLVPDLQRLVREHPLRERFCGQLMLALYRSGRQSEALRVFQDTRTVLVEELGVEPSPELKALELRILEQDEGLAAGAIVDTGGAARATTAVQPESDRSWVLPPPRSLADAYLLMDSERLPLTRAVTTIGRLPDQTIVISDEEVSRRHAEIRRTGSGFVLRDLGSTNGTTINGEEIAQQMLKDGDEIRLGSVYLRFEDSKTM